MEKRGEMRCARSMKECELLSCYFSVGGCVAGAGSRSAFQEYFPHGAFTSVLIGGYARTLLIILQEKPFNLHLR